MTLGKQKEAYIEMPLDSGHGWCSEYNFSEILVLQLSQCSTCFELLFSPWSYLDEMKGSLW